MRVLSVNYNKVNFEKSVYSLFGNSKNNECDKFLNIFNAVSLYLKSKKILWKFEISKLIVVLINNIIMLVQDQWHD